MQKEETQKKENLVEGDGGKEEAPKVVAPSAILQSLRKERSAADAKKEAAGDGGE